LHGSQSARDHRGYLEVNDTAPQRDELQVRPYDDIVDTYGLTILQEAADWSLEDGDLAMTKDGDIKVGDTAYDGLFRLVQTWRFSEAHLRYLFGTMKKMGALQEGLDERMNTIGEERMARFNPETHLKPDPVFAAAFNDICDQQATAIFGAGIYAGSLMLMLSGALLRLRDDIGGKEDWTKAGPLFNGHSLGQIVEAGANVVTLTSGPKPVSRPPSRSPLKTSSRAHCLGVHRPMKAVRENALSCFSC
jgi:hypothetical protein